MNLLIRTSIPIIVLILLVSSGVLSAQKAPVTPRIFCFYGLTSLAPENTVPAIEGAYKSGFGTMIKVHLTGDNHTAVIRNKEIRGTTTGTGLLRFLTFEELRKLDAGSWYDNKYKGLKVPDLDEILDLMNKNPLSHEQLIIEYEQDYKNLDDSLKAAIKRHDCADRIIIKHVSPELAAELKSGLPGISIGHDVHDLKSYIETLYEGAYDFIFVFVSKR